MLQLLDTFISLGATTQDYEQAKELVALALNTKDTVELEVLTGGITNQLLKAETPTTRALVRLFGRGTATFINRDREAAVHSRLAELGMAAPLYARFGNGMIYGWAQGVPASYTDLSDPHIAPAIARKLGEWHSRLLCADIPFDQTIYDVMESWIDLVPAGSLPLEKQQIHAEFAWFKSNFGHRGGPIVMGHNDLLCGNILLLPRDENTQHSTVEVQFIDYEYAQRCPRAFDIANHFMEWQGYDCDVSKLPDLDSELVHHWISAYLEASGSFDSVESVVDQIRTFWGLPGFYWGLWAAIQSTQSEIDFDYKSYCVQRFNEYLDWKRVIDGSGAEC